MRCAPDKAASGCLVGCTCDAASIQRAHMQPRACSPTCVSLQLRPPSARLTAPASTRPAPPAQVPVSSVFNQNEMIDTIAITKGRVRTRARAGQGWWQTLRARVGLVAAEGWPAASVPACPRAHACVLLCPATARSPSCAAALLSRPAGH